MQQPIMGIHVIRANSELLAISGGFLIFGYILGVVAHIRVSEELLYDSKLSMWVIALTWPMILLLFFSVWILDSWMAAVRALKSVLRGGGR